MMNWAAEDEEIEITPQQTKSEPSKQKSSWAVTDTSEQDDQHQLPEIPKTFDIDEYVIPEPVTIHKDAQNLVKYSWVIEEEPEPKDKENPKQVLVQKVEFIKSVVEKVNRKVAARMKWVKYGMASEKVRAEKGGEGTTVVSVDDTPILFNNRKQIQHHNIVTLNEVEEQEIKVMKSTIEQQLKLNKLAGDNIGTLSSIPIVPKDTKIGLGPSRLQNRPVKNPSRLRADEDEGCGLRVTNLSENCTENDIHDLFGKIGKIKRVFLARDKKTNLPRGFGYVTYERKTDAANAIKALNKYPYDHLILNVELSEKRDK